MAHWRVGRLAVPVSAVLGSQVGQACTSRGVPQAVWEASGMIIIAYFMVKWFGIHGIGLTAFIWLGSVYWLDRRLAQRERVRADAEWARLVRLGRT
jgi:hypothetical protein